MGAAHSKLIKELKEPEPSASKITKFLCSDPATGNFNSLIPQRNSLLFSGAAPSLAGEAPSNVHHTASMYVGRRAQKLEIPS
jgi:hypothetical protein